MIHLEHISKSFGDNHILRDISFSINKGEIVSIIGPNGAGKTTLLRTLNWLEKPDTGSVTIADASVNAATVKKSDGAGCVPSRLWCFSITIFLKTRRYSRMLPRAS